MELRQRPESGHMTGGGGRRCPRRRPGGVRDALRNMLTAVTLTRPIRLCFFVSSSLGGAHQMASRPYQRRRFYYPAYDNYKDIVLFPFSYPRSTVRVFVLGCIRLASFRHPV